MASGLKQRKIVDYEARRAQARLSPRVIDKRTQATLRAFRPTLEARLSEIVSDFQAYVDRYPECRALFESEQGRNCITGTQGRHWLALFDGAFDDSYFAQATRIGQAHERAGLEPRWYMGAYCHVLNQIVQLAVETYQDDPARLAATVQAITRVVEIDMDLAIAVYDDSRKAREARAHNAQAATTPEPALAGVAPLRVVDND
jgi:hypothetical protein